MSQLCVRDRTAVINAYKDTISMLQDQARIVQMQTHEVHPRSDFTDAIDLFTSRMNCENALLSRIQIVGR